jgi:hypothetical protein
MEKLAGIGKVLKYALPAAAGGIAAGYGAPKAYSALTAKKPDKFSESEKRMFARHGIDPNALNFYQTMGNLVRGMKMQRQFMEMAMGGKPAEGFDQPSSLLPGKDRSRMSQYA